jgi:hypothetical protein
VLFETSSFVIAESAEGLNTEGPQQCTDVFDTHCHAVLPMLVATRQMRPSLQPVDGIVWLVHGLLHDVQIAIRWDAGPTGDLIRRCRLKHGAGAVKSCNSRSRPTKLTGASEKKLLPRALSQNN